MTQDCKKWDARFLALAEHVASWSKDPSTQVGAVIVDDQRRVVSLGYNGFAKGVDDTRERLTDRAVKYKMMVHAEVNAILFANRSLLDCTIYTWPFQPCAPCASIIIQSGIKIVVAPAASKDAKTRWEEDMRLARDMFFESGIGLVST